MWDCKLVAGRYTQILQPWQAETRSHLYQLRQRLGFHLAHQASTMCLHRGLTDAKFAPHLFIQKARDYKSENLTLARSEAGIPRF